MCRRKCRIRYFECPECGATLTAPKVYGMTHAGHIKTMWCFRCGAERDFVQTDSDRTR